MSTAEEACGARPRRRCDAEEQLPLRYHSLQDLIVITNDKAKVAKLKATRKTRVHKKGSTNVDDGNNHDFAQLILHLLVHLVGGWSPRGHNRAFGQSVGRGLQIVGHR